jgi:hypothetical protein
MATTIVPINKGRASGPVTTAPLYEILDHLSALFESLEGLPADDPLRPQCEADIAEYLLAEIRKVDNIANYLQFCHVQQNFAAQEIRRLQERKAMWERRQQNLEAHVQVVMVGQSVKKLEGRNNTIILRPCPASVEITDVAAVPQEYIRVTVEETPDKVAIKAALQAKQDVPGARLVTDKKSVVLR